MTVAAKILKAAMEGRCNTLGQELRKVHVCAANGAFGAGRK